MSKRSVLFGSCLFALSLLLAVYAAGFGWRQVAFGLLAVYAWVFGVDLLNAARDPKRFIRVQFRIGIRGLAKALVDGGIYSEEEIAEYSNEIWATLGEYSDGHIEFTWLQPDLFFMQKVNVFAAYPELTIGLIPLGDCTKSGSRLLRDCIELRPAKNAYELVLIKAENRKARPKNEGPSLTLIKLPYEFMHSLQGLYKRKTLTEVFKLQREILEKSGLTYWEDEEVWGHWDYRGEYANLHWWKF